MAQTSNAHQRRQLSKQSNKAPSFRCTAGKGVPARTITMSALPKRQAGLHQPPLADLARRSMIDLTHPPTTASIACRSDYATAMNSDLGANLS